METEKIYFFSLPVAITGANFALVAPFNFLVKVTAGRGEVSNPFLYFLITMVGVGLIWVGLRGWKMARRLNMLKPDSDFLVLSRTILHGRVRMFKILLVLSCLLFAHAWVFPGPIVLLATAGLVAWVTNKYLIAKAELLFVREKEAVV
jgi:hypothetical protein